MSDRKIVKIFIILLISVVCLCFFAEKLTVVSTVGFATKKHLPVYSVETDEKKIAITFDCAWGVDYTDKLLEEMERYSVRCTFFTVQFWTDKYPEYIKKISEKGHEIGTHSATHSHMNKLSKTDVETELNNSAKAIETITGKSVNLFRAPFGEYNDQLIVTSRSLGFEVIQWDVDSLDWKDLSAKEISFRVISKAQNGSIILCHNNGLHTAEALPLIFVDLINKGYKFVPVGELIHKGEFKIDSNGRQHAKI